MAASRDDMVAELLDRHGRTYAYDAGITLADKPSPLYQLLVLATLLSARISADIAVNAARALWQAGWRTPKAMAEATWAERTRTLNRSGYARYDERTSRMLGDGAHYCRDEYGGDLRRLHEKAHGDAAEVAGAVTEFKGIGRVGADIFCREVQAVWTDISPYVDDRAASAAKALKLPSSAKSLEALVPADDLPRLVAALVRSGLAKDAEDIRRAASAR
jgi:endonuclease III